jgi:hypothetical protein
VTVLIVQQDGHLMGYADGRSLAVCKGGVHRDKTLTVEHAREAGVQCDDCLARIAAGGLQ